MTLPTQTHAFVVSLALGIASISACGGTDTPAERPAPDSTTTTAAASQVDRGAALYGEHCASCHGAGGGGTDDGPPVVGAAALPLRAADGAKRDVDFATAGDVFRWVRVAMPGDDPGSLSDDEYAAILAFALQANGVDVAGTRVDEAVADGIRLH